jgi:hypothetical protein
VVHVHPVNTSTLRFIDMSNNGWMLTQKQADAYRWVATISGADEYAAGGCLSRLMSTGPQGYSLTTLRCLTYTQ